MATSRWSFVGGPFHTPLNRCKMINEFYQFARLDNLRLGFDSRDDFFGDSLEAPAGST